MTKRLSWGALLIVIAVGLPPLAAAQQPGVLQLLEQLIAEVTELREAAAWSEALPGDERFVVLSNMANEAVLDRETGLVWQRVQSVGPVTWNKAVLDCVQFPTGGRYGWRLPTVHELGSLLDGTTDTLPNGHPFTVSTGSTAFYWSTTPRPDQEVPLIRGFQSSGSVFGSAFKSDFGLAWCVRGGTGVDSHLE